MINQQKDLAIKKNLSFPMMMSRFDFFKWRINPMAERGTFIVSINRLKARSFPLVMYSCCYA
jgi:hypothetical protein